MNTNGIKKKAKKIFLKNAGKDSLETNRAVKGLSHAQFQSRYQLFCKTMFGIQRHHGSAVPTRSSCRLPDITFSESRAVVRTRESRALRISSNFRGRTFKTLLFPIPSLSIRRPQLYRTRSTATFAYRDCQKRIRICPRYLVSLLHFYAIHKGLCRISSSTRKWPEKIYRLGFVRKKKKNKRTQERNNRFVQLKN